MPRRAILVASVVAVLALMAIPNGASASNGAPARYSAAWLALNHTKYDTPATARYEAATGYTTGGLSTASVDSVLRRPRNVRMSNVNFAGNQNEFQIDLNPSNHLFAVGASNDGRTSGTGYYRTADGGKTWFAADLPLGQTGCCDPGVAYAANGTVYFLNLDLSPAVAHIMRSTDNGVTWSLRTDVPVADRPNIVVDNGTSSPHNGRLYLTWTDFNMSPIEIRLAYSDNGGGTWSAPINVSHVPSPGSAYPQSSQPRVANDGTVYVGFQYYPNGTYASAQDLINVSHDGGATFDAAPYTINAGPNLQGGLNLGDQRGYFAINGSCSTFRHRSFPIIGVDPTNAQNVYATWAGGNLEMPYSCGSFQGVHSDILFSKSTDGGHTWSAPLKVNDDPPGKDQYYPWMDVAADGTIWIGWHDRRNDPNDFTHMWYVDHSSNGGTSFGTDKRIANFASLPSTFIGDYAGLAAENDIVLPMWWDSRDTASGDPYTARVKP
jgi:hypothetical protein